VKKILSLIIAVLLLTTGCGQKTSLEVLDDVIETMNDVISLKADYKVAVKLDTEGVSVDVNLPMSLAVQKIGNNSNLKINVGENALLGEIEAYGKTTQEDANLYFESDLIDSILGFSNEETEWLKATFNLSDLEDVEDKDLEEKIKNLDYKKIILEENFVLISKDNNIGHYQFVVNKALIERLANELGEEFKMEGTIDFKVDTYINLETNQITKVYVDLKDMLSQAIKEEELEGFDANSFKEVSIEINFSGYNNTTVTIPSDVINNSLDYGTYLNSLMPDDYYDEYDY